MIDLGLTQSEREAFEETLLRSRRIKVDVDILDQNEKPLGSLTDAADALIGGEVVIDLDSDVSRSLSLEVIDVKGKLQFDPNAPSDAPLWPDRFLAVTYSVWVPDLAEWVSVPVFWGPVTYFQRDHPVVSIQALGKESLLMDPAVHWRTTTIRRNTAITTAIKRVTGKQGETRYSFDGLRTKTSKTISVNHMGNAWRTVKRLAKAGDRQVFYDGLGRLRLRRNPENPVFVFRDGDDGAVLTRPTVSFNFDEVRNTIEVLGPKPATGKKRVKAKAISPPDQSLSPEALKRDGDPRWLVLREEGDFKRKSQAQARADRLLREKTTMRTEVIFESQVIPHLEERDIIRIETGDVTTQAIVTKVSIPLTAEDTMTFGTLDRVLAGRSSKRRRRRRNRGGKGGGRR